MADVLIDGSPVRAQERAVGLKKDLDAPASVVSDYFAPASRRHLPQMLLATTVVAVLPLVVSLGLRASGVVSGWASVGLAVALSLGTSTAGSAYWRKRGRNTEVLFGELLLWGWIRSWRQERELANATRLLALVNTGNAQNEQRDELTIGQREHLLQQLAGALEGQDVYLNGHSRRVARHATMIARGLGLPSEEVARIRAAAAVHDVGKLRTPKAILNKPGRLTEEEFAVIKRHPVDGAEMVAALGDPELTRIVRHHHERLDGAGYPNRLCGEEIPLGARIIAVADTFDAITSARPYRDAAPHQKAIDILRKEAGTQLDPDAVRSFLAYYSGSRPTIFWAIITSSLRRLVSWLSGDPAAAATISAGKVAAATAATAAIGVAAGAAPVPVVHHAPARPLVSHATRTAPAHSRGVALRTAQRTVSVLVPTTSRAKSKATSPPKVSPGKTHRRNSHTTKAKGSHALASHARAAQAGTGSKTTSGTPSHTVAATRSTPSSAGATRPSVLTPSAPAATRTTSRPSATANHSQGSNASGNAYGHTKPLGNGHGQGEAKGHGGSGSSSPTSPSSGAKSTPAATVSTTPSQGNSDTNHAGANGNGNAGSNDSGNGNGNGNANGQGHGNGQASVSAVTSSTDSPTASQNSQSDAANPGNGAGQSGGNGNAHGHDG